MSDHHQSGSGSGRASDDGDRRADRLQVRRRNGVEVSAVHGLQLEGVEGPIDLVALQADDDLVNAIAAGMVVPAPDSDGYGDEERLIAMLVAWKAEVDAEAPPATRRSRPSHRSAR